MLSIKLSKNETRAIIQAIDIQARLIKGAIITKGITDIERRVNDAITNKILLENVRKELMELLSKEAKVKEGNK